MLPFILCYSLGVVALSLIIRYVTKTFGLYKSSILECMSLTILVAILLIKRIFSRCLKVFNLILDYRVT